jgi:hypothetical protein
MRGSLVHLRSDPFISSCSWSTYSLQGYTHSSLASVRRRVEPAKHTSVVRSDHGASNSARRVVLLHRTCAISAPLQPEPLELALLCTCTEQRWLDTLSRRDTRMPAACRQQLAGERCRRARHDACVRNPRKRGAPRASATATATRTRRGTFRSRRGIPAVVGSPSRHSALLTGYWPGGCRTAPFGTRAV